MDKAEFAKIMMGVAENFSADLSEGLLEMFYSYSIEDGFKIEQWRGAAKKILKTRKYSKMPTYADFYEAIIGNNGDKAKYIAGQIVEAIKKGATLELTDPVANRLMSGRWSMDRLRETMTEDGEVWFIKEFIDAYIARTNVKEAQLLEAPLSPKLKKICDKIG